MLTFNDKLKEIKIRDLIIFFACFSIILLIALRFNIDILDWIFVALIGYILFRTRHCFSSLKNDITHIYSKIPFKIVFLIFLTNFILAIGFSSISDYLLNYYPWLEFIPGDSTEPVIGLTLTYIFSFIDTVIIAPVSEELIFRGILLNRLNEKLSIVLAIIISSLLFAVLHGFGGLMSAFVFGVSMCFVYILTENIFVSMSIHFLNNLVVMLLMFIPNIEAFFENSSVTYIFYILSIISMIWLLKFMKDNWDEVKNY